MRAKLADLFELHPTGLVYEADAVSSADETALVQKFADLPFKPFEFHGYLGNRRVVSFGWRYDYAARKVRESTPLPDFLQPLRDRAGVLAGLPGQAFEQALVTEYAPGAGIGWHRDKPAFRDVAAFSFLSSCTLRFRRKRGAGWERLSLTAAPRSAYLLRGDAREVWEHSIPPVPVLRYSVTFRTLASL
jgi:alkylated DNA repair dioxygenase AlkB